MIAKIRKPLAIITMLLLSSLLSSVQIAAGENDQGEENEVRIWKIVNIWSGMKIEVKIRVEISTVGLFSLTLEKPYVLISFELNPKGDNYPDMWIEAVYEGLSGPDNRKLSFDEASGFFYFPPTQIRLDPAGIYPFNTYRAQFTLSGESVSFSGSGENPKMTDTPVTWLNSKIKWEDNTVLVEMKRDTSRSIGQSLIIIIPFLLVFWFSIVAFKKSTKKGAALKKLAGAPCISFVTAIGFVYTILAGVNMELMPIGSPIFLILIVLGICIYCKYFGKYILERLSKHEGGDTMGLYQMIRNLYHRVRHAIIQAVPHLIIPIFVIFAILRIFDKIKWEEFLIVALVVITAYHAIQTSKTVGETQKARRTEILPRLKLTIVPSGPNHILMRIVNIGKGAARDINVKYWLKDLKKYKRSWNVPFLMPNKYLEFPIPTGKDSYKTSLDFFTKESRKLRMKVVYSDILGFKREDEIKLNVKEMIMLLQMQGELGGIKKLKKSRGAGKG